MTRPGNHHILCLLAKSFVAVFCFCAPAAWSQNFGSNLSATPNLNIGCDLAPILNPITGVPMLAPTGQTTCTMRNFGYLYNTTRITSFVPRNGKVTEFRVRSGPNPAPLKLTISEASLGTCCTARAFSRVFRPKANKISTFIVNMQVARSAHQLPNGQLEQITDVVGLSAVGLGSLPLHDEGSAGTLTPGSGLTQFWYPLTPRRVPRVEGIATADGLELLFRWKFVASKRRPIN